MGRHVVWTSLVCERCQQPFRVKPCQAPGRRFCSAMCRSLALPPPKMFGNQHASKGDQAGKMAMHYRARKAMATVALCNRCPVPAEVVHHRDENPRNNDPANLERLCRPCHINHHRPQLEAGKRAS